MEDYSSRSASTKIDLDLKVSCLLFDCQSSDSADCAEVEKNIYRVKWIR